MKLVTVIFPQARRDKVVRALADHPVPGLSLTRTEGFGQVSEPLGLLSGCRIELILPDEEVEAVIGVLESVLSTGRPEDGVVFWQSLEGYRHF